MPHRRAAARHPARVLRGHRSASAFVEGAARQRKPLLHPLHGGHELARRSRLAHRMPASGTTMYSASGHARASASAAAGGQMMS
jgi:hypothetical protein